MHVVREKPLIFPAWPCGNVEHRRALAEIVANHLKFPDCLAKELGNGLQRSMVPLSWHWNRER